jgi:hypothetical protein
VTETSLATGRRSLRRNGLCLLLDVVVAADERRQPAGFLRHLLQQSAVHVVADADRKHAATRPAAA